MKFEKSTKLHICSSILTFSAYFFLSSCGSVSACTALKEGISMTKSCVILTSRDIKVYICMY